MANRISGGPIGGPPAVGVPFMLSDLIRKSSIYRLLKKSRLYDYITLNRDAWVKEEASAIPAGSRVLDVGAGSCPYRKYFAKCIYKTQDFISLPDDQLRDGKYGQIDYISEIASIPVADGSFDVVLCTEVLEHLPNPIAAVKEMGRILRPKGTLLLSAPLGSGIHQAPFHYYGGYTPFWYQRFLGDAGFADITVSANGGFFKMFGWECVRFVRMFFNSLSEMPLLLRLVMAPVCFFVGVLIVPLIAFCDVLDRYDKERAFTAGYHVRATRL